MIELTEKIKTTIFLWGTLNGVLLSIVVVGAAILFRQFFLEDDR